MGRPREHDESTRFALLEAAERLIEAGGPDAVSVRTVADEVGTTTRAVYSLFGSKQGLLVALAGRAFDLLAERITALPVTKDPAGDLVEAGVHVFRHMAVGHPSLFRLAFQRVVPDLPRAYSPGDPFGLLCERVARLEEASGLGGRTVDQAANQFNALCEGLANVELRIPGKLGDDPEQAWRDALATLVAGFGVPATRRSSRAPRGTRARSRPGAAPRRRR